jgi:tellurite resistance protein TehA-like permease
MIVGDFFQGLNTSHDSPFWAYAGAIVFPLVGIYLLWKWTKIKDTKASAWNKAIVNDQYRTVGIGLLIGGIMFIFLSIYELFFKK